MISFKGAIKDIVKTFDNELIITIKTKDSSLPVEELQNLNSAQNGIKVDISKWSNKRSLNANNYFHLLVHEIAKATNKGNDECKVELNLEYGTPLTDEENNLLVMKLPSSVKATSVYEYPKFHHEQVEENGYKTSYYILYKRTHILDTSEMARLIDGVVYEAKNLGIQTETPDKIAEMKSLWSSNEK